MKRTDSSQEFATLGAMATEMVFSGGHRVNVAMTNAQTLIQTLNRPGQGQPIRTPSGQLAPGWVDIQTEEEGLILVNPAQVAYVRDVSDMPQGEETAGSLSNLEARRVRP